MIWITLIDRYSVNKISEVIINVTSIGDDITSKAEIINLSRFLISLANIKSPKLANIIQANTAGSMALMQTDAARKKVIKKTHAR